MEGLTEGRMVHYVLSYGPSAGEHRPAIIVKVWNQETGTVNLAVFMDGSNDTSPPPWGMVDWQTSRLPDLIEKRPGTWHWIEKA